MNIQSIQTSHVNYSNRANHSDVSFRGTPMAIGNMKMNMLGVEAGTHIAKIAEGVADIAQILKQGKAEVGFAPTSLAFSDVRKAVSGDSFVKIGAQEADLGITKGGAVTGGISQDMYKELGADFTLIGHSERRTLFAETDEQVNLKTLSALEKGLKPVVCVGESLAQREAGEADKIILGQVVSAFQNVKPEDASKVVVAYEPLWAINTGKTCDADEAQRVCKMIRDKVAGMYDEKTAKDVSVLYGGSVNEGNADVLFSHPDIDGGLVGGACLNVEKFVQVIKSLVTQKVAK